MDHDDQINRLLGSSHNPYPRRQFVPRRGENLEFDHYFEGIYGQVNANQANLDDLRMAAWVTWKTPVPSCSGGESTHLSGRDEDEELASVLAISAEEHQLLLSKQGFKDISIDDFDQEDLRRGIAQSQAEVAPPNIQMRENTPEQERRMLEQAIAASLVTANVSREAVNHDSVDASRAADATLQTSTRTSGISSKVTIILDEEPSSGGKAPPVSTSTFSFGGQTIDRIQLEKERLERQESRIKMEKVISEGPRKATSIKGRFASSYSTERQSQSCDKPDIRATRNSILASSPRLPDHPLQSSGPWPVDAAGEYYLDGELRHVSLNIGATSIDKTFSPREVFANPAQISLLIMSSFCWNNEWLDTILPPPDICPTIKICRPYAENAGAAAKMHGKLQPMPDGEIRCYPEMNGKQGSEHMKFAWVFYKTGRLRIVILTGNMVEYDWTSIENTVFVQDFLPLNGTQLVTSDSTLNLSDFPQQFRILFAHLKIHKALRFLISNHPNGGSIPFRADNNYAAMAHYNWERVKVRLVLSVPGTYRGYDSMSEFGICRLAHVLKDEGWTPATKERLVGEYQGSSLGRYSLDWYSNFYQFCTGRDLGALARLPKAQSWPPLKIIYPSLATVNASILGRAGGGTMFSGSAFNGNTAPLFHDAISKRGGVLMHTKMIISIFETSDTPLTSFVTSSTNMAKRKADQTEQVDIDSAVGGWIYVGSHNFSPSAWGTVNFKNSPPTLNLNNYELGLVFPLPREKASIMADKVAAHKRPVRPYGTTDTPWSQIKHM